MASTARCRILTSLVAASLAVTALPAAAFSLFGIHLWGSRDDAEDPVRGHRPVDLHRDPRGRRGRRAAAAAAGGRLLALDRPRAAGLGHRRAPVEGARRLPAAARRALRRGLLRPRDQHPRPRPGGRRPDARRRVPAGRGGRHPRRARAALPLRRHRHRQPPAARGGRERRRRRRDAGVGRLRHRRAGLFRDHRPGLGHLDRALAAARLRQGARDRPRGGRRPCQRPPRRHPRARPRAAGALRPAGGGREEPGEPRVHQVHGRPRGRRQLRPRRGPGGAGPADPARRLPLAALRGGRGDRARRQPADHRRRRGPPPAHHRLRRHALDDRRRRRQRLLAAPQPLRPRRAAALRRRHRRAGRVAEPRGLRLQPRRHLHPAGGVQPGHQLHRLADRAAGQLRHLPRAVGDRLGRLLAPCSAPG